MILMGFGKNELSERLKLYYGYVNSRTDKKTSYSCSNKKDEIMLQNMAMVEHERWIASHKLMGYQYNPENDYVKKYHKCICPWDSIDEETQSYDCNVVDKTIKMAYEKIKKQTNIAWDVAHRTTQLVEEGDAYLALKLLVEGLPDERDFIKKPMLQRQSRCKRV